jgi:CRISPR-associated endonuclease Csy4
VNHYIDIRLRPDPDFPPDTLLDALFAKLHRALARYGRGDIGVSFPDYDGVRRLGAQLRLHGQAESLKQLMAQTWLTGMLDHVVVSQPTPLPSAVQHRIVRRVQAKSSPERLRRRQMRRHGLNEQQALEKVPDSARETLRLPYVQLKSTSTGHAFPLFIRHGPPLAEGQTGHFSTYGLSDTATVPWF